MVTWHSCDLAYEQHFSCECWSPFNSSCSQALTHSLERIQSYAMRVILSEPPGTPSAPLRTQLGWSTLHKRRQNFLLCQVHRCVLLNNKFVKNSCYYSNTRGADKLHYLNLGLKCIDSHFHSKVLSFTINFHNVLETNLLFNPSSMLSWVCSTFIHFHNFQHLSFLYPLMLLLLHYPFTNLIYFSMPSWTYNPFINLIYFIMLSRTYNPFIFTIFLAPVSVIVLLGPVWKPTEVDAALLLTNNLFIYLSIILIISIHYRCN